MRAKVFPQNCKSGTILLGGAKACRRAVHVASAVAAKTFLGILRFCLVEQFLWIYAERLGQPNAALPAKLSLPAFHEGYVGGAYT
jgi:hypothetical protein